MEFQESRNKLRKCLEFQKHLPKKVWNSIEKFDEKKYGIPMSSIGFFLKLLSGIAHCDLGKPGVGQLVLVLVCMWHYRQI